MTPREDSEFTALRDTIRTRGTARVWIFVAGVCLWACLVLATVAWALIPLVTLVSLVQLSATFEAVFALHVGAERIGRYLQVFHDDRWERTAMNLGAPLAGTGSDPLFGLLFGVAAVLNFVPVLLAEPVPIELGVIGGAHALLVGRIVVAHRSAGGQRATDLERFRHLKSNRPDQDG